VNVYHGSYIEIKEIDLSKAKPGKDFGRGFYVTNILQDAKKMAEDEGKKHNCVGVVSEFKFNYNAAFSNDRYVAKKFDGYTLEWLDFIIINRKNFSKTKQAHEYDIVEGPIADDVVAQKIRRLPDNPSEAEKENLLRDLKYYRHTHQICFCTGVSLDTIERIDLDSLFKIEDIGDAIIKHLKAIDGLLENDAQDLYFESETYKKVSDEKTGLYNKQWQEVYEMLKKETGADK
jgi:hypothetical protein